MGIRWRKDGRLVCAAMTIHEPGDVLFDDRQTEVMAERGVILPDPDHFENGLWHWAGHVVPDWSAMRGGSQDGTTEHTEERR